MEMFEEPVDAGGLRPQELEAVYAISSAVAQAENIENAMDEIVRLSRPVFIFDSMMLYLPQDNESLEPAFVRVVGRGQAAEGDNAWGEAIASETFRNAQTLIKREELKGWHEDRLSLRYYLGLPLRLGTKVLGAVVFARFGGPPYSPDQIHLSEFIASHVAQLMARQQLVQRIASLEAERRLERLQQDFIATISHELCTPLGFVKGYATTLLREDTTWDDDTRREFLTIIDEEADKLRELIDNLLDSSRLQSGTLHMQFQPVRLDTLLRDMAARASSRNEGLVLKLELKKTDFVIQADPTRVAQVMDNLISNAVKYAPGAPVAIILGASGDMAQISVHDEGPGIPEEHIEHLFKRFFRVPEHTSGVRGTGLGLFICRHIVRAHSGDIKVESRPGEGTTFHVLLPVSQGNAGKSISLEEMV